MAFVRWRVTNLKDWVKASLVIFSVGCLAGLQVSCQAGKGNETAMYPDLPGSDLFREECSKCHDLERALRTTKDEAAWDNAIRRMRDLHKADISEVEILELVNYHVVRQKKEAAIFQEKCQKCHPGKVFLEKNLTPSQAREVVRRMQEKAGATVTDEDVEIIVNYHIREHQMSLQRTLYGIANPDKKGPPPVAITRYRAYFDECSGCHRAELPTGVLKDRSLKEKVRGEMLQLGRGEIAAEQVDELINAHSQRQNNELESFQKVCTTCHSDERITIQAMTSDQWLTTIRRMQAKAPELITDEKVTVLAGFFHRREMVLSTLFYDNCSQCHFPSAVDEPTLSGVSANMDNLIFVASQRFGDGVVPSDITELVGIHNARERKEMAVFAGNCVDCHLSNRPRKTERSRDEWIGHIGGLQQKVIDDSAVQRITIQMGIHRQRKKEATL